MDCFTLVQVPKNRWTKPSTITTKTRHDRFASMDRPSIYLMFETLSKNKNIALRGKHKHTSIKGILVINSHGVTTGSFDPALTMPSTSALNGIVSNGIQAQFGPIYAHTALLNFRDEMYLIAGSRHVGGRCRELPKNCLQFFLGWKMMTILPP